MALLIALMLVQEPDIASLIEQLGADRIERRDAASAALRRAGLPALGPARRATRSPDAEIRRRAEDVVDHLLFNVRGQIVFARSTDLETSIWTADPDDPEPRKLIQGPRMFGRSPHMIWLRERLTLAVSRYSGVKETRCVSYPKFDLLLISPRPGVEPVKRLEGGAEWFALSPDHSLLATTSSWGDYHVVDAGGGSMSQYVGYAHYHFPAAWSPDGKFIFLAALGNNPGLVRYELATGVVKPILAGHFDDVIASPGGNAIYVCDLNEEWTSYDPASWKASAKFHSASRPQFSPDRKRMIIGGGRHQHPLTVTDLEGRNGTTLIEGFAASWSPDGKRIVIQRDEEEEGILFIWNVASGKVWELCKGYGPLWTQ